MAAPCRHVGRILLRKKGFLPRTCAQLKVDRTFTQNSPLLKPAAESIPESTETIVIPQRKTWSKEAVLEALAASVSRDPTAYPHQFQDDPYFSPKTPTESKLFTLSLESGRSAARYFINSNPRFFSEDFAEPHVPVLMPTSVSPLLDGVSEEALKERISLRRVKDAVDMYDQLLQAGASVSTEVTHDLLDLLCLYCDRDPAEEAEPEPEDSDGAEAVKRTRSRTRRASDLMKSEWKENNNAERIFSLLPERDTRGYSALIRGMVKHGAYAKAFSTYTDLLNDRLTADVHIFNALISAAPEIRDKYNEKWEVITELLKQMNQQKVQPNLLTFNSVLKALKRCGSLARVQSLHTLNEMKALGIAPSLASFDHILAVFFKGASRQANIELFQEMMSELAGRSFTCQDPDDAFFFMNTMRICVDIKDMDLAYKVQRLLEVGDNWRFLANSFSQTLYYGRFFSLLCMMEHIDVVMKWYRRLVPSLYYPSIQGLRDLLQALDTDSRLDLLPSIWKDIRSLGHDNKSELVEELLALMARDRHSPEVQDSFAACALDVKGAFDDNRGRSSLEWTPSSLSHITALLLRANRTQQAWEMLQLFKSNNRVPAEGLLEEFLSLCHSESSSQRAVELVQLSAAFCLPATPGLATRTLAEFELTEEQRAVLSELESAGESSE